LKIPKVSHQCAENSLPGKSVAERRTSTPEIEAPKGENVTDRETFRNIHKVDFWKMANAYVYMFRFFDEVQLCTRNDDDFTIKMLIVCSHFTISNFPPVIFK
jgi:hypothetical protein